MVKKKTEIEAPVNAALQASITPVGIEFGMNKLRLGENYCRIYGIFMLPTEVEYGWLSKLTNIPGTRRISTTAAHALKILRTS